ncbi:MAG: hypothetical protein A3F68_00880 [Acidobacteria bacterium RIFCSPLOWO2_12_FULL_54_10]|nr:MAG: hypothetical protein A3F68_00880 [Acidobacteria bacterium RIFCSPLOWO2_12_FULL_54_10]
MKQDGGFLLESPPQHAATLLDQYAEAAPSYGDVVVLLLPYARIPAEVSGLADIQADLGARVFKPQPNSCIQGCVAKLPARSPRLDVKFREEMLRAILELIDREFPEPDADEDRQIACDIIRGLAVHSKMGPQNHSHEDDLWKACQVNLKPGGREAIIRRLMVKGILDRKKNNSAGGTGWVYWIAEVKLAKAFCPDLAPYFE